MSAPQAGIKKSCQAAQVCIRLLVPAPGWVEEVEITSGVSVGVVVANLSVLQHSVYTECERCMLGLWLGPCQLRLGDVVCLAAGFFSSDALKCKEIHKDL